MVGSSRGIKDHINMKINRTRAFEEFMHETMAIQVLSAG